MTTFLTTLRGNLTIKKILYYGMILFLFLYVFSIPSFSGREKWNIISYFLMAAFAGFTLSYTFIYSKFIISKRLFLLPLFVCVALVGTITYSHEYRSWLTLVLLTITFFLFYFSFCSIKKERLIIKTLIIAFFIFTLYFCFVYRNEIIHYSSLSGTDKRLGSFFDNVNQVGSYMSISVALTSYIILFSKSKKDYLYIFPFLIFFLVGFLTGSRTFILTSIIIVFTFIVIKFWAHKFILFIILASLIILFFILINLPVFSFIKTQLDNFIYTIFGIGKNSSIDHSTVARVLWQKYGVFLSSKRLFFGFGNGGFSIASGIGTYTHGNASEILCNFGIIGFILFTLVIAYPFILKNKNIASELIICLFIYFIITSILSIFYYNKDFYIIIGFLYYLINKKNINKTINIKDNITKI